MLKGNTRDTGGLSASYPVTFARLKARANQPEAVVAAFLESKHFDSYKELPYCGAGLSIEEAFFRFMDRSLGGRRLTIDRAVLQHEFLMAIMAILASTPNPHFLLRTRYIRHNGAAYIAFRRYDRRVLNALGIERPSRGGVGYYLYAATTDGRLVHGPIAVEIIRCLTARHKSPSDHAARYRRQLAELGVLPPIR